MTTVGSWRKSIRSGNSTSCVEVASGEQVVGIRDSKNRAGAVLLVPAGGWATFVTWVNR
ncbi:DUF397 domain-containing protein [Fodinicola feengrottensis]|uniref:DUF397 domain-containing protein n=1 Tax=Fodinicola feengrottensis TaxID=435914 RepID=UPI0013D5C01C|nr:DUF397 domain-containing protein [Fodinicola feengrottensis]